MYEKINLPHNATKEEVVVYYHPSLRLWPPNTGEPITLNVYGKLSSPRSGISRWVTDLVDLPEGQLGFMQQKELRTLITSLKSSMGAMMPDTVIKEIRQDIVDYAR